MADTQSRERYRTWIRATGFDLNSTTIDAINRNLRSYRACGPSDILSTAIIAVLTVPNAMIERWPLEVRVLLNQKARAPDEAFDTWARPRDMEKRVQAIAIWSNMLGFITFCWEFSCADLEAMGLFLSEDMKSLVENISFWIGYRPSRNIERMKDAAMDIFILALEDKSPSPRTNPLLWWTVVLISSQIFESQPEIPFGLGEKLPNTGYVPNLSFHKKLEALYHYATVLVVETFVRQWSPSDTQYHPFRGKTSAMKNQVVAYLDKVDNYWVDEDQERPQPDLRDEAMQLNTLPWQECLAQLQSLVRSWLAPD